MRTNVGRDLICSIRNLFDCEKWELDHSSENSKSFEEVSKYSNTPQSLFIWYKYQ